MLKGGGNVVDFVSICFDNGLDMLSVYIGHGRELNMRLFSE